MKKRQLTRPLILYADDHRYSHELMSRAFKNAGVQAMIFPATDGLDALHYLSKSREMENTIYAWPNLVLIDLKMPRLSGVEFLQVLKNSPEFPGLPIVAFTSLEALVDLRKAKALGCCAVVSKQRALDNFTGFAKALDVEFFGGLETETHQKFSSFCVRVERT